MFRFLSLFVCFVENMLSSINKTELAERARRMRATKVNLVTNESAPTGVVHVHSKQNERTTSALVFKRRRSELPIPSEHSYSNGRATTQNALTIQECEVVGSSKGKRCGIRVLTSQPIIDYASY